MSLGLDGVLTDVRPRPRLGGSIAGSRRAAPQSTVLCITDDSDTEVILRRMARRWANATLLVAPSAQTSYMMIATRVPHLVVIDEVIFDRRCSDLLAELRHTTPCAMLPILVLSANGDPTSQVQYVLEGASAVFTKPLNVGTFDREVRLLLGDRS
jgi:DNA-binding response OmpR family regulator